MSVCVCIWTIYILIDCLAQYTFRKQTKSHLNRAHIKSFLNIFACILQISVSHHSPDKSDYLDEGNSLIPVRISAEDVCQSSNRARFLTWHRVRGQGRGPVRRGAVSHHVGVMRHWRGRGERWMPGNRLLHEFLWD